jgi:hypothetical protein
MKKSSHPIDDFFREALSDHEVTPSPEARSAFLAEASRDVSSRRSRRTWWILTVGILLLTAVSVAYFYSIEKKSATPVPAPAPSLAVQPPSADLSTPVNEQTNELKINNSKLKIQSANRSERPVPSNDQATSEVAGKPVSTGAGTAAGEASRVQAVSAAPLPDEPVLQPVVDAALSTPGAATASAPVQAVTADTVRQAAADTLRHDTVSPPPAVPPKPEPGASSKSRPWSFNLGANYTAEWMFNTLEGRKYVNNFGLEVIFRFERYSIRTGAGWSITEGANEWLVEYNDYLGQYNKLDSMDFTWDNSHYNLLPTYYMSEKDVWDSLVKMDYPTIVKRYTYLQIPLILGYDVIRSGRFTAGFRAGPILSILLSSKQLTSGYDPGKNNVILINQISPDRVQMNWQVMGGINASLLITRRLSFELEPEIRYYFNSVYEKSDITKKPWSVGIRAAFLFKF